MSVSAALSALERSKAQLEAEKAAGQALRQQKLIDQRHNPLNSRMRSHLAHSSEEQYQRTFHTLHCTHCTHYTAITSQPPTLLPTRHTDNSHILQTQRHWFKLNVCRGAVVALRRDRGVEKQWRWCCRQCKLPVAYQCEPWTEEGEGGGKRGGRKGRVGVGEVRVKEEGEEERKGGEKGDEAEGGEGVDERWPAIVYLMRGALTTAEELAEREESQLPSETGQLGRGEEAVDDKRSAEEMEIERAIAELTRRAEEDEQEGRRQAERMTTHGNDGRSMPVAVT